MLKYSAKYVHIITSTRVTDKNSGNDKVSIKKVTTLHHKTRFKKFTFDCIKNKKKRNERIDMLQFLFNRNWKLFIQVRVLYVQIFTYSPVHKKYKCHQITELQILLWTNVKHIWKLPMVTYKLHSWSYIVFLIETEPKHTASKGAYYAVSTSRHTKKRTVQIVLIVPPCRVHVSSHISTGHMNLKIDHCVMARCIVLPRPPLAERPDLRLPAALGGYK